MSTCGGDLNVILNQALNTTSKRRQHDSLSKFIKNVWEDISFSYVWRELHPKRKDLTHYSATHKVYLRIDFFLIQKENLGLIEDCGIGVTDVLDHSAVYLKVNLRSGQNTIWTLKMGILNHNSIKL